VIWALQATQCSKGGRGHGWSWEESYIQNNPFLFNCTSAFHFVPADRVRPKWLWSVSTSAAFETLYGIWKDIDLCNLKITKLQNQSSISYHICHHYSKEMGIRRKDTVLELGWGFRQALIRRPQMFYRIYCRVHYWWNKYQISMPSWKFGASCFMSDLQSNTVAFQIQAPNQDI